MLARLKLSTAVNPASASARNMARPISPSPNTAIGASRGTSGMTLHHQRLHATGAALRQDAARTIEHFTHPAPGDVQVAAYRSSLVRALEGTQDLVADGVFTLRHRVEPGGHAQQSADRRGAVPHARAHVIGILRGTDQHRAEQLRGPGRSRRGQQPLDARATFDAHHAGDLTGIEQLLRRAGRVGIEGRRVPRAPPRAPRDNSCRRERAESRRASGEFRGGLHQRRHRLGRRAGQDAVAEIEDAAAGLRPWCFMVSSSARVRWRITSALPNNSTGSMFPCSRCFGYISRATSTRCASRARNR